MRGAGIIAGALLAWGLGLADGEALARVQSSHVATSMAPGADASQVQSVVLEWIRVTATSNEFIAGIVAGLVLAVAGRFLWSWICMAFAGAAAATRFVIHHRLIAIAAAGVGYYGITRFVLA